MLTKFDIKYLYEFIPSGKPIDIIYPEEEFRCGWESCNPYTIYTEKEYWPEEI